MSKRRLLSLKKPENKAGKEMSVVKSRYHCRSVLEIANTESFQTADLVKIPYLNAHSSSIASCLAT